MAFTQFPNQQYFKIIESSNECSGGYFNIDDGTELEYIMATIYINGTASLGGSEQLQFNIYGSEGAETPVISSEWASLSDISPAPTGPNWIGNIYFTFDYEPLNPNINYYFAIQARNYTRNLDTFYIGVNLDWYSDVNTAVSASDRGFRIRILGYR